MTSRVGPCAALVVVAALATACGSDATVEVPAPPHAPTSSSLPGAPVPPVPVATPGPAPTIPPEVRLPHEGEWRPLGWPGRTPLQDVCIDPGQGGLYLPETEDYRAVGSGPLLEALGVYRGPGRAHQAIGLWREQARVCGGPGSVDHVGLPMEWVVRPVDVEGADEAWQAHLLMTVEGPDLGALTSLLTIVRVGNAVYVTDDRRHSAPSSVGTKGAAGLAAATAYVPALAGFGDR